MEKHLHMAGGQVGLPPLPNESDHAKHGMMATGARLCKCVMATIHRFELPWLEPHTAALVKEKCNAMPELLYAL